MWHAWERRGMCTGFDGKARGKRPLGRQRRRWKDGIRMDLKEIGWETVDWIQMAQDRDRLRALMNTVMNLRVLAPRSYLVITILILSSHPPGAKWILTSIF
jgi:hypothetical protein